ncbi:MAG: GIY-YIG nuclease family protein [Bacteroidetes bacterium]|nr:GIY-YIG nuclease family protein [Bacteroidota bacterium]
MDNFYVYIIHSSTDKYYIGQTKNLDDRINRHNTNRSEYTKNKGKWKVVSYLKLNSRSKAVRLENKLKYMKNSKKAVEYLNILAQSIPTKSGGS